MESWWGHVLALDGEPHFAAWLGSEDVQVNVRGAVGYAVTHQFLERLVVAGFCPVAQDVAKALPWVPSMWPRETAWMMVSLSTR